MSFAHLKLERGGDGGVVVDQKEKKYLELIFYRLLDNFRATQGVQWLRGNILYTLKVFFSL